MPFYQKFIKRCRLSRHALPDKRSTGASEVQISSVLIKLAIDTIEFCRHLPPHDLCLVVSVLSNSYSMATRFDVPSPYFKIVAQYVLSVPNGPLHSCVSENWFACPKSFTVSGKSTP